MTLRLVRHPCKTWRHLSTAFCPRRTSLTSYSLFCLGRKRTESTSYWNPRLCLTPNANTVCPVTNKCPVKLCLGLPGGARGGFCFAVPVHNCTGLPCQLSKLLGPDTRHHSKGTRVTCSGRFINHRMWRGLALDYPSLGGLSQSWSRPAGATAGGEHPSTALLIDSCGCWKRGGRAGSSIRGRREGKGITSCRRSLQTRTHSWVGRGKSRSLKSRSSYDFCSAVKWVHAI